MEWEIEMTDSPKFNAIAPQIDLPAMEHSILDFWKRENIFEKSLNLFTYCTKT